MKLLNEIVNHKKEERFANDYSDIETVGYMRCLPKDFVFPFKKGDEVYIDDFALAKYRYLDLIDSHLNEGMRLSNLLANANRTGYVTSVRKNLHKRNSGKLEFVVYTVMVGFNNQGDHGDNVLILKIKNHDFLSHKS